MIRSAQIPPSTARFSYGRLGARLLFARGDAGFNCQRPATVRPSLLVAILMALAVLAYSNSLHVPFLFDDIPNILDNPHIRLMRLSVKGLAEAGFNSPLSRRPVANISFALNHILHRYEVTGYHLVNIAIHMITGVVLFFLLETTLLQVDPDWGRGRERRSHSASDFPADGAASHLGTDTVTVFSFWVAAIWMVHPVHIQTVTYIVQRMNGLAAMFTIMALYGYARARIAQKGWRRGVLFTLCALSVALALGSKENAATLPFFIFLYEWYFFQDVSGKWLGRQVPLLILLLLSGIVVACLFLGTSPVEKILATYRIRDFTPYQRILTQFRVVVFYLSLLLFPHPSRLNLDHQFPLSYSLTDPVTTLAAILFICGMATAAVVMARRNNLISYAIFWFFGNLAVESSVIGLELVFEHRTYLPSIAVCGAIAFGIYRWIKLPWTRLAVLFAIVVLFSFWTYTRNEVWQSGLSLWADCATKSPDKARPQNNLGNELRKQDRLSEAKDHYRKALHLLPGYIEAQNNLGVILAQTGRPGEAIAHFQQALKSDPGFFLAHRNLGGVLLKTGETEAAMVHLKKALALNPFDAEAHYLMGNIFLDQGNDHLAFSHYTQALKANPDHAGAHTNAGILLARAGRISAAISHFQAAVRLRPDDAQARANLAQARKDIKETSGP